MTIEILKKLIHDNDIDKIENNLNNLSADELNPILDYLLKELRNTNDGNERNTIAYLLGEIKCQKAASILIELIFKPELKDNRGTLIFALDGLECEKYIYQLLPLLYEGNYEVVMNTHMLLQEHVPKMDIEEQKKCLKFIKDKIEYYEDILSTLYDVHENIFYEDL